MNSVWQGTHSKPRRRFRPATGPLFVYNGKPRPGSGATVMVTLQTIKAALGRIRDSVFLSPFVRSETFSKISGHSIFFKLEHLQMTGSYKERGALNKILLLTD